MSVHPLPASMPLMDDAYLQFVVGLLDDKDGYSDYLNPIETRERMDSITEMLPNQVDFLMRDRAFSWDLLMEEQLYTDVKQQSYALEEGDYAEMEAPTNEPAKENDKAGVKQKNKDTKASQKITDVKKKIHLAKKTQPLVAAPVIAAPAPSIPNGENTNARADTLTPVSAVEAFPPQLPSTSFSNVFYSYPPNDGTTQSGLIPHSFDNSFVAPFLAVTSQFPPSLPGRIGAYTKEERQVIIAKFRAKKQRRIWRKQIKYDCRKRLADTRPRVKGRFVSRKERKANGTGAMVEEDAVMDTGMDTDMGMSELGELDDNLGLIF